ncbi:hypothetical protein BDY24DRAFT_442779 [Mrakia frigida]|uniref:uncharacterized protein n=1 Tax=Mrakia frigida TaxID=29902 RepID=UPI003FCC1179
MSPHQPPPPETHLVLLLPFDRPEGFVDPPAPTSWDPEKELILNSVLDQSQAASSGGGGVGNVDWSLLSESLETPIPILLYRAKARLARQLEALRLDPKAGGRGKGGGARGKGNSMAVVGVQGNGRGAEKGGIMGEKGEGGGDERTATNSPLIKAGWQQQQQQSKPSVSIPATSPPPVSKPTPTPIPAPPPPPPPPQPPVQTQHRRPSSSSSSSSVSTSSSTSSSSSSSTSPVYTSAILSPSTTIAPLPSVTDQLRALASLGGGAFSLPSAPTAARGQQQQQNERELYRGLESGGAGAGGSKGKEREQDVSPTPSSPTRGVGSGTSSFSDLSNASLTQSALEEAAMSAMNRAGGSRMYVHVHVYVFVQFCLRGGEDES